MSSPIAYGIDFGTSNSSVVVAYPERVALVPVEPTSSIPASLPSLIYIGRTRNELAGSAAVERYLAEGGRRTVCGNCSLVQRRDGQAFTDCRLYRAGGGCQDARLISSIKGHLAAPGATHSWGRNFTFEELVAVALGRLKQDADRWCNSQVPRAVIGYPVAFSGTEGPDYLARQHQAETCLKEAARLAGFTEVVLYPEPAAAAMLDPMTDGLLLALDFGGGTFDAALIRFARREAEVIALKGTSVGGQLLDEALFTAKVASHLGLASIYGRGPDNHLPNWLVDSLSTLAGVTELLGDRQRPTPYEVLNEFAQRAGGERLQPIQELLYGGYAYAFYRTIEEAKIRLSTETETRIRFDRARINLDIPLRRDEYEALIRGYIERVIAVVFDALDQAQVAPEEVTMVVRTGGSGQTPLFVRQLNRMFGVEKVHERNAFTTVALGLGAYAQAHWAAS